MLNNFNQLTATVSAIDSKAITISGKAARFPVSVLTPILKNFENNKAARRILKDAMTNAAQVPLLNELRQVWILTKMFGSEISMTGGVGNNGLAGSFYHAELGILSASMATKYKEANPSIDISGCYLCIGIDGNVIPLVASEGRNGGLVLKSPKGISYDIYPDEPDSEVTLEVSVGVEKMGKFDIPVFHASLDKYTTYTGRVSSFREQKAGVVGFQDRHTAQEVVNAIDSSFDDGGASLADFVREISSGGGGDKFGVPFSSGAKGIYPISAEGIFIVPSASGTFENTLVSCVGPNGVQKFRLSPQQGQVLQAAISLQYPVTDATGKVKAPNQMFAALNAAAGLALAYVGDTTYTVQKGKRIGQQAISEEIVLISHQGKSFIDGTGLVWDQASNAFKDATAPVSTEINTFFATDESDDSDDTAIIPETVFQSQIQKAKSAAPTVATQTIEQVELGDDEDDDYESSM